MNLYEAAQYVYSQATPEGRTRLRRRMEEGKVRWGLYMHNDCGCLVGCVLPDSEYLGFDKLHTDFEVVYPGYHEGASWNDDRFYHAIDAWDAAAKVDLETARRTVLTAIEEWELVHADVVSQ